MADKKINDFNTQTTLQASDFLLFQRGSNYYRIDAPNIIDHLDTDDMTPGSTNIFATNANLDTWLATKDSDDVTPGSTNIFATTTNLNTWLATKDLDDLADGGDFKRVQKRIAAISSAAILDIFNTPVLLLIRHQFLHGHLFRWF